MTPLKTRILLADDHAVVRQGLRRVLDAEPDLEVVAESGDGRDAVRCAIAEEPHLAVLDVAMPEMTGLQAARELRARLPQVRVLILSMHDNEQYVVEAVKAGAAGYVLKTVADRDLADACRAVMRGEPFVQPRTRKSLTTEEVERLASGGDPSDPLTGRETEVLKLVAEGRTNREIAEALMISEKTVQRHRANILGKLGMSDRVELTRYAIRRGLVQP